MNNGDGDAGPPRGRARSRTFSEQDLGYIEEIDSIHGGPQQPRSNAAQSRSDSQPSPQSTKPGVSRQTMKIMTNLNEAIAVPGNQGDSDSDEELLTEEKAAEKELADAERRRREAAMAANAGGGRMAVPSVGGRRGIGAKRGDDKEFDVQMKILLLGDSGVGKTSLMMRFSEDKFSPSLLATAGVDYKTKFLDFDDKRVKCQIWDTAGQQRFHVITHSYYKTAHGIVLVYDASDAHEETFNNVRYWMENIQKHSNPNTKKILIGNKIDIKPKQIDTARGKELADSYGMKFFETSAKEGTSVKEAFTSLSKEILDAMLAHSEAAAAAAPTQKGGKDKKGKDKDCTIM